MKDHRSRPWSAAASRSRQDGPRWTTGLIWSEAASPSVLCSLTFLVSVFNPQPDGCVLLLKPSACEASVHPWAVAQCGSTQKVLG